MIQLKDVSYVRLGSPDLEQAESFSTACLGLQIAERGPAPACSSAAHLTLARPSAARRPAP
jgi:hypothetical protein